MSTDLIRRLHKTREWVAFPAVPICVEAANEIARLEGELVRAVAAERERCARSISWKQVCLAYQGDTQPCSTPCLHCSRIETVLLAAIREGG